MTKDNIKVTVLMPVYNAENYIGDAIKSVLEQTFIDFELLIVNDGSTDNTEKVIQSFSDPRIVLIQQARSGVGAALNTGLKFAKAEYIARFDADDVCYPHRIEIQYKFIISNPEYIVVGSAGDYMDMDGNYIFTPAPPAYTNEDIRQLKYKVCPFIHSGVFYKKEIILNHGGYNVNAHTFEDHLLWLSIANEGKFYNFSQALLKVRLNPQSITIDEKWRTRGFSKIKYTSLKNGHITESEGKKLLNIIKKQDVSKIKEGSYYALLGKKFLWNNHQPQKAREYLKKVFLTNNWFDWKSYCFLVLSYLPGSILLKLYKLSNAKRGYVDNL